MISIREGGGKELTRGEKEASRTAFYSSTIWKNISITAIKGNANIPRHGRGKLQMKKKGKKKPSAAAEESAHNTFKQGKDFTV